MINTSEKKVTSGAIIGFAAKIRKEKNNMSGHWDYNIQGQKKELQSCLVTSFLTKVIGLHRVIHE